MVWSLQRQPCSERPEFRGFNAGKDRWRQVVSGGLPFALDAVNEQVGPRRAS